MARLAVVGDIHESWDERDAGLLDAEGYDGALFVGDFFAHRVGSGLETARRVASLRTPAVAVAGNHDAVPLRHLAAEMVDGLAPFRDVLGRGMTARVEAFRQALGPIALGGYSLHDLGSVQILVGRPHSAGGPRLTYARYLKSAFGIGSMHESARRLRVLVEQAARERPLVMLAHNGPTGLGVHASDPCGRDFHPSHGDWGDQDLRAAIEHARDLGLPLVAVVFGHMHHALRWGMGERRWNQRDDGVLYVNAARVPRIVGGVRHHIALEVGPRRAEAEERWLAP